MNNNNMSILPFVKRNGDFYIGDYVAPRARFQKYGIFMGMLLNRIKALALQYGLEVDYKVFRMNTQGIADIKAAMKGKGGIYIWYSHKSGYFYVGSGKLFFGDNGRLSTYLMPSRVAMGQHYVSPDLAKAIREDGLDSFSVIIVEAWDAGMDTNMLVRQEQLWMLLYPTYNRSLKVGSNEGTPMLEADRRELSTMLYLYEVVDGVILPDSVQSHYGKKELARTGFTTMSGEQFSISNFDLAPIVKSGTLYKGRFFISETLLSAEDISKWSAPKADVRVFKEGSKRSSLVFVYNYVDRDHVYTLADFVGSYSVSDCQLKYGISKTHLQRVRRTGVECKGYRFSNVQLHKG
jgi:group I intron endonuclease